MEGRTGLPSSRLFGLPDNKHDYHNGWKIPWKYPRIRIRCANRNDVQPQADYVLYWMTSYRRGQWNFSLQRAVDWARDLRKPLVVLEALRSGYRWANDRFHRFMIDGMVDNAATILPKAGDVLPVRRTRTRCGRRV